MSGLGSILIATFMGGIAYLLWRRRRAGRLEVARLSVRCPRHGDQAEVAVATDPAAPAGRQSIEVVSCTLVPAVARALPERVGYLCDSPPCAMRMAPACASLHTAEIGCGQRCLDVLNAAALPASLMPVVCSSGVSDAIGLAEQALGPSRVSRLLWYASI